MAYQIVRSSYKPVHRLNEQEWECLVLTYKKSFEELVVEDMYKERSVNPDWDLNHLVKSCRKGIWNGMSPELYTLFWVLAPSHLTVPKDAYQDQIDEIQANINKLEGEKGHDSK